MGNYLQGEKLSTTYKQIIAIGGSEDRDGIHATTQKAIFTDAGDGDNANAFPFTAAQDAVQFTTNKPIEFRADANKIYSSGSGVLNLAATTRIELDAAEVQLDPSGAAGLDVNSSGAITLDATSQNSNFTVAGADLVLSTTSSGNIELTPAGYIEVANGKKLQFADSGEYISGDTTNLTIASGADIILSATTNVNIPQTKGLSFATDDAERIISDGTDLTINSGGKINLTANLEYTAARINPGGSWTDNNSNYNA